MTDIDTEHELPPTIHASAVAIGAHAVLIRGLPRSGKTTLGKALVSHAMRADRSVDIAPDISANGDPAADTAEAFALWISDDRTIVERSDDRLMAQAPSTIAGKIADRDKGIVRVPFAKSGTIALIVDLHPTMTETSQRSSATLLDVVVPVLRFPPINADTLHDTAQSVLQFLRHLED